MITEELVLILIEFCPCHTHMSTPVRPRRRVTSCFEKRTAAGGEMSMCTDGKICRTRKRIPYASEKHFIKSYMSASISIAARFLQSMSSNSCLRRSKSVMNSSIRLLLVKPFIMISILRILNLLLNSGNSWIRARHDSMMSQITSSDQMGARIFTSFSSRFLQAVSLRYQLLILCLNYQLALVLNYHLVLVLYSIY